MSPTTLSPWQHLVAVDQGGPTQPDGRFKPDVVALGTTILSSRSTHVNPRNHFSEFWGQSTDPHWSYKSGTSPQLWSKPYSSTVP